MKDMPAGCFCPSTNNLLITYRAFLLDTGSLIKRELFNKLILGLDNFYFKLHRNHMLSSLVFSRFSQVDRKERQKHSNFDYEIERRYIDAAICPLFFENQSKIQHHISCAYVSFNLFFIGFKGLGMLILILVLYLAAHYHRIREEIK